LPGQRSRRPLGTSVVDGDIQAAKTLDGLVDEVAHVVLAADVSTHEFRFRTERAQFGDQRLPSVVASTGNDDPRTFLSERESRGATDACEGSCD